MKKIHVAENDKKTRIAIAEGKNVRFLIRKASQEHFCSPRQFWKTVCPSFAAAQRVADAWAKDGKVMQ